MAFLDNSGDIILDAVLTDTGRYRLAKGDGSFKITKFALGDDEINYASYDKNNPSGSAYYDLQILQTPVLEAFTNNTSTMKSKLISIARTNLLYLPVIITNQNIALTQFSGSGGTKVMCVAVDDATVGRSGASIGTSDAEKESAGFLVRPSSCGDCDSTYSIGIMNGVNPAVTDNRIMLNQGLNTAAIPKTNTIDAELNETQYIIEIDNRLGSIVAVNANATPGKISFIDDDNIASYYMSLATDTDFVYPLPEAYSSLSGPPGTQIFFKIQASTELRTSTYLFEKIGSSGLNVANIRGQSVELRYIDTIVKVTGATTGYRIDIPVRFIKKVNQS